MAKFLQKLSSMILLGFLFSATLPAGAASTVIDVPQTSYSNYPHYSYFPTQAQRGFSQPCTRRVRQWVPTRYYTDNHGNVERVRGKHVRVRVEVPCR